jgi:hypothetical protein
MRRLATYLCALVLFCLPARSLDRAEFATLVASLSEPEGYFDTDNLISNESTFLTVAGRLRALPRGGVYLGVGPDQNYSYIAHLRPQLAFMVDIRRGNLLEHLLFRSLFAQSRNRLEYLGLLLGRALPADLAAWDQRPIADLVRYIDAAPRRPNPAPLADPGLPLSADDRKTITSFHQRFLADGLDLRFNSHGREPRPYYPRLRDLVLATDASGQPASYLASEDDFRYVQRMHRENRIVPVVANLAGEKALRAIAAYVRRENLPVAAIYTSNVEQYLYRGGELARFAANLEAFPRTPSSLIIRSGMGPYARGNAYSDQLVQPLDGFLADFASGRLRSYADIIRASKP